MRALDRAPAVYWQGQSLSYRELFDAVARWHEFLDATGIGAGTVVSFVGDFSRGTISLMFALMEARAILMPLSRSAEADFAAYQKISGSEHLFVFDGNDAWTHEPLDPPTENDLVGRFRKAETPGLIVFTSGSTGKPKGILHDCDRVMRKFIKPRTGNRTVLFLMMDHFGGFNTMLGAFAYGGTAMCVDGRKPDEVCRLIEAGHAELLPTTPTFLNLLITPPRR